MGLTIKWILSHLPLGRHVTDAGQSKCSTPWALTGPMALAVPLKTFGVALYEGETPYSWVCEHNESRWTWHFWKEYLSPWGQSAWEWSQPRGKQSQVLKGPRVGSWWHLLNLQSHHTLKPEFTLSLDFIFKSTFLVNTGTLDPGNIHISDSFPYCQSKKYTYKKSELSRSMTCGKLNSLWLSPLPWKSLSIVLCVFL